MHIKPGLYIVATPIGNLEDISIRAIKTLNASDFIICEDTRISNKLLAKHGIKKSLIVYNDASCAKNRQEIARLLDEGKILSLISDAGTPLISDPGYKLIRDLKAENYHIDIIPGPSAPITALAISALPTDRFLFAGFLPKTKEGKKSIFHELSEVKATLIFFETAKRLLDSLVIAQETMGDREANVARELTKIHQESKTDKISQLIEHYKQNPPKGEVVLLISGKVAQGEIDQNKLESEIKKMLKLNISAKDITDLFAEKYRERHSRKEIYSLVNRCKEEEK